VHQVGANLPNCNYNVGDKVILFPDERLADSGYAEYLAIDDTCKILQVPDNIAQEVAAMLPGDALSAYAAVLAAKPHVEKLQQVKCEYCVVLFSFHVKYEYLVLCYLVVKCEYLVLCYLVFMCALKKKNFCVR
jgi:hypothetical protein